MGYYRYHIGIDPDCDKSGIACWDSKEKRFVTITTMRFFQLLESLSQDTGDQMIHIEASWLNQTVNYGKFDGNMKFAAVKIAASVGANRQVGKMIEEYCKFREIPYALHKPSRSKMNAETFKKLSGWNERTNSEQRDAGALVLGI